MGSNGDNKVSAEELRCGLQADTDHNGVIDKAEVEAFKRCLARKDKMKGGKKLGFDANGDDKVSAAEAACGKLVDANHNGMIDASETKEFNKCLKQKEESMHKSFHVDFDGNGKVESNEKKFARLFDFNNDGKLGAEELKRAKLAWKLAREEFSDHKSAAYDEYDEDEYYQYDEDHGDYYGDEYYDDFEDYDDALYEDYDDEDYEDYAYDDEAYGQYTDEQWQQLIDEYYNQYADAFEDYDDEAYDDEAYDDNEYDEEYDDNDYFDDEEINALQRLLRQQQRMQSYQQY